MAALSRDQREIVNRLNEMVDDRCRITDGDFKLGLPRATEKRIIDRMTDAGYTIGRDRDNQNEWWPPDNDEQPEGDTL